MNIRFMEIEHIPRRDNQPYLIRWILFRSPWISIYLHKFLDSDEECLHDHPWPFISLILSKGYWEEVGHYWDKTKWLRQEKKWYAPWSLLFRKANHAHRVVLEPGTNPISLVITGQRIRKWGFFTKFGWIFYRQYSYAKHCPD